VTCNP
jgi:hypothetical protein